MRVLVRVVSVVLVGPVMLNPLPEEMRVPLLSRHITSSRVEEARVSARLTSQTREYSSPAVGVPSTGEDTVTVCGGKSAGDEQSRVKLSDYQVISIPVTVMSRVTLTITSVV